MNPYITVTIWTAAIFAAIVLNLALKPRFIVRILGVATVITALGGLAIYGYGYAATVDSIPLAIIKSTFAVCRIFTGGNFYSEIKDAPYMAENWMQVIFWILHVFGLFAAVGTAMTTLGAKLMRQIRMFLSWRGDLSLIYGVNPDTVAFARKLMAEDKDSIVFIDATPDSSCTGAINTMGCILRTDADALDSSIRFLRSIGIHFGKRTIHVYALDIDDEENVKYAVHLLHSLEKLGIPTDRIHLTVLSDEDAIADDLIHRVAHLAIVDIPELAARVMTHRYPPYRTLSFDETGKALEDFHCMVIGFGKVGQAVLRQLVMSGQFLGSHFKAAVFDPACSQVMGSFDQEYGAMVDAYDISFFSDEGRSQALFRYLRSNPDVKYIAVCTGSQKLNLEIEQQLHHFMVKYHYPTQIVRCSHHLVSRRRGPDQIEQHHIYTPEFLCTDTLDKLAIILNHGYNKVTSPDSMGDAKQSWFKCSFFNRASSRASADYAEALLHCAGSSAEQVLIQGWNPQDPLLENLAHTEHLRWNAFMYAMGYAPMTAEIIAQRGELYRKELSQGITPAFKVHKDDDEKLHACITSWDELDQISASITQITGQPTDYKAYDRENVLSLGDLIRAAQKV